MNEQQKKLTEKIRGLLEAATPGEWKWEGDILITSSPEHLVLKPFFDDDKYEITTCIMPYNATFIAAAHNAMPQLLDIIAEQEETIEALEKAGEQE